MPLNRSGLAQNLISVRARVFLRIEVQIVHPRACEKIFGCYASDVSTTVQTEARVPTSPRKPFRPPD